MIFFHRSPYIIAGNYIILLMLIPRENFSWLSYLYH